MISTLPLLFVQGAPISLDDMTDDQMEKFITFIVLCSYGRDTVKAISEPPWWLPDLPFVHPLKRPNQVTRKWRHTLQTLIRRCYEHHNFDFLIELSADLANRDKNGELYFEENNNFTTSIFLKKDRKIVVTIRNENLTYDDSEYKYMKQESIPDDQSGIVKYYDPYFGLSEIDKNDFLCYFRLEAKDGVTVTNGISGVSTYTSKTNFFNTPNIPFSCQLGRRLARKVKYIVSEQTHLKRLERISRYLNTPPMPTNHTGQSDFETTWKPLLNEDHYYHFPLRNYKKYGYLSTRSAFLFTTYCKPCAVLVDWLPPEKIRLNRLTPLCQTETVRKSSRSIKSLVEKSPSKTIESKKNTSKPSVIQPVCEISLPTSVNKKVSVTQKKIVKQTKKDKTPEKLNPRGVNNLKRKNSLTDAIPKKRPKIIKTKSSEKNKKSITVISKKNASKPKSSEKSKNAILRKSKRNSSKIKLKKNVSSQIKVGKSQEKEKYPKKKYSEWKLKIKYQSIQSKNKKKSR